MKRIFVLLVSIFLGVATIKAQYTVGGSTGFFKSLSEAFDVINGLGFPLGEVELQIIENTTEPASTIINKSGADGMTYYTSIIIYPVASNLKIEFSDPLLNDAPMIDLNGACNVTIDGRVNHTGTVADLTIVNTSTGSNASTIRFVEGASDNTVQYCKIRGAGTGSSSGTIFLSTDDTGTGNDNNNIKNNLISSIDAANRPVNSIFSLGSTTAGHENSGNIISDNEIFDFLNKSFSSAGVYVSSYSTGFSVTGNSFYETTVFTPAASVAYYAIRINNTAGSGFNLNGNYIGGRNSGCGGLAFTKTTGFNNTFTGINLNAGPAVATNIQGNTIKNINWTNSGNGGFYGINIDAGSALIGTITGNTIGDPSVAGSVTFTGGTVPVHGIRVMGGGPFDIRNNLVANLLNSSASAGSILTGINLNPTTGTNNVQSNFIQGLFVTGSSALVFGIRITSGTTTYANNIIRLGGNTATTLYGIYESGTGNSNSIYFNTVYIDGSPVSGNNNSYGVFTSVAANTMNLRNNILFNNRSNSGATGKHYGVYITNTGGITGDYNDYYAPGTGGITGYYGADMAAIPVITGQDVHSLAIDPVLASAGGTAAANYLPSASLPGVSGTGITTDYFGTSRSIPTMGALEGGVTCTNPTSGGTISSTALPGCSPYDPAAFSATAATGGSGGSVEYKWFQSVTGAGSGFSEIPGATGATYDGSGLTQTTWFKRIARSSCMTDWTGAVESNVISVTVNAKPTVSVSGATPSCFSTILTSTTNAASPTYEWYKDNIPMAGETGATITVTASGSYRVEVTDGTTSCMNSSVALPVTINHLPTATLSGSSSGCVTTTLTATSDASGPSFKWYKDDVEIAGQTASTLVVSASGAYKFKVTDGITSCENTSAAKTITINTPPAADRVVNGTTTLCSGSSSFITIALSESDVNYQLRNSAGNINIGSAVTGTGGTISLSTGVLTSTTTINILATRISTSCSIPLNETETITVDAPSVGGSISGGSASIVYGSSTGTMTLSGHNGSIVKWQKKIGVGGTWQDITNTTVTYDEAPSSVGSWYYRVKVKSGVCPEALSIESTTSVTAKPIQVTANNQTKTYGTTFAFNGTEFTATGLVTGDAITSVTFTSSGSAATALVGSSPYSIVPSAAAGTGLTNYTITYVNGSMTVNPAALTITANNQSKTYGSGFTFNGTEFTTSGLLNSDAVSSVTLTSTGSGSSAAVSGSPYPVVPSAAIGTGLGNYTISYVNGQMTVNPAALTITVTNQTKTYGTAFSFTGTEFTTSGLLGGDAVTSVTLTSSGTPANAGTASSPYSIVPSAATGTGTGNYNITYVNGLLTVTPASLTITAKNLSKTYGTLLTFTTGDCIVTGLVSGDAVSGLSFSCPGAAANAAVSGSPYTIAVSGSTGTGLGNYNISYASGSLNITPASLTLTANNLSKTYGTTLTFAGTEFTATGLASGDVISSVTLVSSGSAATAQTASSPYTIVPSAPTGTGLGNYTITYANGQLTVNPAPLGITAYNQVKTYGSAFSFTGTEFSATGLVNGNTVTQVTLTSSALAATANASGTAYPITPSAATGSGLGNYTITYNNGSFTVNKATLTVTADNKTRKYGESNPAFTLTYSGFVNNESQSVIDQAPTVQTTAGTSSNVGSYSLIPSGGSDNNYTFTYVNGTLTITKQQQTITITGLPEKLQVGSTCQLTASSTSGLTVSFECLDAAIASVTGTTLTGLSRGTARIRAFHAGDQNYEAAEATATIEIKGSHKDIMNLFTPNGDGFNDYWELPKMDEWGKCDVRVYNRWGKLVYANPDYNNLWDGTSNGAPLPEGAYYFIINTENSGVVKGTLNIVR